MSSSPEPQDEPLEKAPKGPFRGLAPFDANDSDALFFFGRAREQDVLIANLTAFPLTVLYGPSGVGKSSLLRAGVAHRLLASAPDYVVVVFGTWTGNPAANLKEATFDAVNALAGPLPPLPEGSTLTESLQLLSAASGGQLYIILDQFEEYFLYHENDLGDDFAHEFPAAVNDADLPAHFFVSVREDALARLDRFKGSIPGLFANYLRLDLLSREEARSAVLGPIERYNGMVPPSDRVRVQPTLVDEVLDQVTAGRVVTGHAGRGGLEGGGDSRVEAPYLQLVMQRLWSECRARGSHELDTTLLRDLGGAGPIVRSHVEEALGGLDVDEMGLAARIFNHLITPSGTKIALDAGDLSRYADVPEEQVTPLLARLANERILRPISSRDSADVRYEIFHDVLADALLAWRTVFERRRDIERERERSSRRHRRLLIVVTITSLALAVMSVLAIVAVAQWQQAQRERSQAQAQTRLAQSRELSARAVNMIATDPESSLRLGLRAAELAPTREAADSLRLALLNWRLRWILGPRGGEVVEAVYSPDGRTVATASRDGEARIFDAKEGKLQAVLHHNGAVMDLAFDGTGTRLATASRDGSGRLWETASGRLLARLQTQSPLNAIDFSHNGTIVVTGGEDGIARIWDAHSGDKLRELNVDSRIRRLAVSPNGRLILTVDGKGVPTLWRTADGTRLLVLPQTDVRAIAFSARRGLFATGDGQGKTFVWESRTDLRERVAEAFGHSGPVTAVAFRPDGSWLVTGTTDGVARVWRTKGGQRVAVLRNHTNYVTSVAFNSAGDTIATGSRDRTARLWEPETGRELAVLIGHKDTIRTVQFNARGTEIVTASEDGTARIWDATDHTRLLTLAEQEGPVATLAAAPAGRLVVSGWANGTAEVFDSAMGARVARFEHGARITSVALSPDGQFVATGGIDGDAALWEARSGRLVRRFEHGAAVNVVGFGASGQTLVTAGEDGWAYVWKLDGSRETAVDQSGPIVAAALSSDGSRLVTAARQGATHLWSRSGRFIAELDARNGPLPATEFSPDGRMLVTAGVDDSARIWNARDGRLLRELKGHRAAIADIAFTSTGDRIVTAGIDHDARIWRSADGKLLHVLRGHFASLAGAVFTPDGRWVITAGPSTAGLWESETGALVLLLRGHDGRLVSALPTQDGKTIATAGVDGTVRIYRCVICGSLRDLVEAARARLSTARRPVALAQTG